MTSTEFATLVRLYTSTNSSSFTDAEILALANPIKDEIAAEITKRNEDYFMMRFYRNLEAGVREYGMPDEILNHIKYVQAKLDGSNLEHLTEADMNSLGIPLDETNIVLYYADRDPQYDINRRALYILSGNAIIDVTDGLILHAIIFPANITVLSGSTDMSVDPTEYTFGFPRIFHELWARKVSVAWKSSRPKPIPLSPLELRYDKDLEEKLNGVGNGNLDRSVAATVPVNDGQGY